jgi:hypothetical protein
MSSVIIIANPFCFILGTNEWVNSAFTVMHYLGFNHGEALVHTSRHLRWYFFSMALPAHSGPRPLIQFRNHFYTDGRTPCTSDQPVARPLPKHRTTWTQNKRIHTPNIHALSGIRAHDPSVRASEDSSCLRPRGYCDRLSADITGAYHILNPNSKKLGGRAAS